MRDNPKFINKMADLEKLMDETNVPVEIKKEMLDGLNEVAKDIDRIHDWPEELED